MSFSCSIPNMERMASLFLHQLPNVKESLRTVRSKTVSSPITRTHPVIAADELTAHFQYGSGSCDRRE